MLAYITNKNNIFDDDQIGKKKDFMVFVRKCVIIIVHIFNRDLKTYKIDRIITLLECGNTITIISTPCA